MNKSIFFAVEISALPKNLLQGGARKLRIQLNSNRGKSDGGRVIYVDIFEKEKIYRLFAYPKNVQANLTAEQKRIIKATIDMIKKE